MRRKPRYLLTGLSQTKHIRHRIMARFLLKPPKCRLNRTSGEQSAIGRNMAQLDPLTGSGKQNLVFADDIAAPDRIEPDCPGLSRAGYPVTPRIAHIVKRYPTPFSGGFAKHQGGAGRCVDLVVVVGLDHLDVEFLTKGGSNLSRQPDQ